jgi:hypothetical protein
MVHFFPRPNARGRRIQSGALLNLIRNLLISPFLFFERTTLTVIEKKLITRRRELLTCCEWHGRHRAHMRISWRRETYPGGRSRTSPMTWKEFPAHAHREFLATQ